MKPVNAAMSICLLSAVLVAQSGQKMQVISPMTVTVCEILSKPMVYDGKLVHIRGEVVGGGEGAWFKGEACPGVFTTEGHTWESLISIQAPGSPLQIHPVDFEYDLASFKKLTSKYENLSRRAPDQCIAWTYTGVFETREVWPKMIDGRPRGFGHLNVAPGELIVKSADDVALTLNCSGENKRQR
jgi:hypothetical protein